MNCIVIIEEYIAQANIMLPVYDSCILMHRQYSYLIALVVAQVYAYRFTGYTSVDDSYNFLSDKGHVGGV